MNILELKTDLEHWDRKHVEPMQALYQKWGTKPDFIPSLIELYRQETELEHATTWLIKHHIDQGGKLELSQYEVLYNKLDQLDYWESSLHVLQIIKATSLNRSLSEILVPKIEPYLQAPKKFLKAAAFEAYAELLPFIPELKTEFLALCEYEMQRSSASVKVKLRRILISTLT